MRFASARVHLHSGHNVRTSSVILDVLTDAYAQPRTQKHARHAPTHPHTFTLSLTASTLLSLSRSHLRAYYLMYSFFSPVHTCMEVHTLHVHTFINSCMKTFIISCVLTFTRSCISTSKQSFILPCLCFCILTVQSYKHTFVHLQIKQFLMFTCSSAHPYNTAVCTVNPMPRTSFLQHVAVVSSNFIHLVVLMFVLEDVEIPVSF